MEHKFDREIREMIRREKRRKVWKRVLSGMMCLVVFVTTYALILPAITKETNTFCGIEEHTHSEACYEKVLLCENHVHTLECYGSAPEQLVCTEPVDDGHTHTESCSPVTETKLTCEKEETDGHIHEAACEPVTQNNLTCGKEEIPGHTHTESCNPLTQEVLSCTLEENEEHTHDSSCYTNTVTYGCGLVEAEGHAHDEACYTQQTTYGCGLEEVEAHTHDETCYTEVITYGCGLEEVPPSHTHAGACYVLICALEATPDHEHADTCYEEKLTCEKPEHTHGLACYADLSADLESAAGWEATLPELTGYYEQDMLAIAQSQMGYTESARNYVVSEDNSIRGYTRYGAWYGIPYGDWCAMFVSFCMHYAGVEEIPTNAHCPSWVYQLQELDLYKVPSEYVPESGDLIFFDWDGDDRSDHVGLVEEVVDTEVITIEGNSGNCVAQNKYELHDKRIVGYGIVEQSQLPVDETIAAEENQDATTLDKNDTNAWVELVGDSQQAEPEAAQEEIAQPAEKQSAMGRMLRSFGGATTFGLTRNTRASSRAIGTPLDLTPYINNVAMYDSNGNPIPSGSVVTEGDVIEFKIEYTVTGQQLGVMNGEVVEQITDTLTYDLPKIFQIVRDDSGNIRNSAGQVVGTYVIDSENGKITMTFTEDYVEQNAKGIQIHGYISFFSTVTKITEEDGEHQDFKFTDGITLGVIIEEESEAQGDLKIEKQKVEVDGEEILYEIKVTSKEGTNGPITITDQMSTGLTFKELVSVKKGNTTVNNPQLSVPANKGSFTMTLPEMAAGESYIIRYRCTADVDLLDANMTVQNTATVTGKDSDGKELKDNVTVDHTFDVIKKTGNRNEDGSITWTVTINRSKVDISGWVLEDRIGYGSSVTAYTGPVTIVGSNGNVVASNVALPYTFPKNSTDTYTVTYTTTHGYGEGDTIYNTAVLKFNDKETSSFTGVDVGAGSPFEKTGEAGEIIQDANGNYLLPITWTVTIDTTNGPIPGGVYFDDTLEGDVFDEMYMTYDQIVAALNTIDAKIKSVSGQEITWFTAWEHKPSYGSSDEYCSVTDLLFNPDACKDKVFDRFAFGLDSKGIPQGHVLTFTYEAYGVFPNGIISTTTFRNRFSLMGQYEVQGRVDHTEGTVKATKYAISNFDPETQGNQDWFWGTIDWNGVESTSKYTYKQLRDSYLAWAIELSTPLNYAGQDNITIYEDLPDGVSVKGMSLSFNSNIPTASLKQWDMVPGQTYKWEFPLYTAEQYYYWNFRNPQNVSIDIKVTDSGDLEITVPGIIFKTMSEYAVIHNSHVSEELQVNEWFAYLHIFTQINDDFEWTPTEEDSFIYVNNFENRFTIKNEKDVVIDIGSQTQIITKNERDGMIKKTATTEEDNIITYSVVLNAYKKDLIENSGTLAVHDELTYQSTDAQPLRMRLVPGSVKLYEIRVKSDGTYDKLREVTTNYKYEEIPTEQNGVTNWSHTIDLTVPDSTSLLLEYSYKASGDRDVKHNVSNTCSISGVGQGNLEGDTKVEIEVKDATAQADITGVMLYKVDANSDGIFLENAKFNIYIWNEDIWNEETGAYGKYIIVHHPNNGDSIFTTDANGMIVLDGSTMDEKQFAYNTAYYIVEIESPNGYYLGPEPYYFYIRHDDTVKYPPCIPSDFTGRALTSGDIIYRQNVSEFTEITVEKYWKDYGGKTVTVTGEEVTSVTLELWQMLQGSAPSSAKKFGTYTMTPDENGNWRLTIKDLPKATKNADGTKGTNYLYFIKEVRVGGYTLESAENNSGINYGTIKLVNKETEGYILPETGGAGTQMYTTAGLLLMLTSAAFLVYIHTKRRREAP